MGATSGALGGYHLVRKLGTGGMAEAFLAVRTGPGGFEQRVCLKRVLPAFAEDAEFLHMFETEAAFAASLRHGNIVGVIEFGDEGGVPFMALELVDGVDLRNLLRQQPDRKLDLQQAVLVATELAHALDYAHRRTRRGSPEGIVHRDVTPSNVMVSYAGEVKLTDFGVAKAMQTAGMASGTGSIKGKVPYMAPEQAQGLAVDGRSDLFSLGVVFYEMLAGRRPFDGSNQVETLKRIADGIRPPVDEVLPEVPDGIRAILDTLLAVNPDKRYHNSAALVDALAPYTPPATSRRALGELAEAALPPQTLMPDDLGTRVVDSSGVAGSFEPTLMALSGGEGVDLHTEEPSGADGLQGSGAGASTDGDQGAAGSAPGGERGSREPHGSDGGEEQVRVTSPDEETHTRMPAIGSAAGVQPSEVRPGRATRGASPHAFKDLAEARAGGERQSRPTVGERPHSVIPGERRTPDPEAMVAATVVGLRGTPDGPARGWTRGWHQLPVGMRWAVAGSVALLLVTFLVVVTTSGEGGEAPLEPVSPVRSVAIEPDEPAPTGSVELAVTPQQQRERDVQAAPAPSGGDHTGDNVAAERSKAPRGREGRDRRATLKRGYGRLRIGVFPWGRVWLDGRLLGNAPIDHNVRAGKHTLAAGTARPRQSRVVEVESGSTQRIMFDLSK